MRQTLNSTPSGLHLVVLYIIYFESIFVVWYRSPIETVVGGVCVRT